jgi:hypothetical protein
MRRGDAVLSQVGGYRKPGDLGGIPFLAHPITRSQQREKLALQHEWPSVGQKTEYPQQLFCI